MSDAPSWDETAPAAPAAGGTPAWDDTTPAQSWLGKTALNILPDLKDVALGAANTVKEGAYEMPKRALDTGVQLAGGVPYAETPSGQKDTQFVQGAPQQAAAMARPVTHPIQYTQEHPVQQLLNVISLLGGYKAMKGEPPPVEGPKGPPPPPPPGGPGPLPPAEEAPKLPPPEAPPAAPATSSSIPFMDEAKQAMGKANDVKNYISRGYQGFSNKPGMTEAVADYIQSKSQKMAAQEFGMSPLQARKMGATALAAEENVRALGQYALDSKIVSPANSLRGMLARHAELLEAAGDKVGEIREMADKMHDPVKTPVDVLQAIKEQLGDEYEPGMPGSQEYQTALKIVEKSKPTFAGAAEASTKLNKLANTNNAISQPHKPFTDVANIISQINNERIKQIVGPLKAEEYDGALKEFGANKKIGEMLKRKVGGEVKRFGPGSTTSNMIQKGMDEFGYKAGSKIANKVSTSILKNPAIAKSLPSLFKEFINQVEDVGNEITGMSDGGLVEPVDVAKEVHHYLRKQFDPGYGVR